MSNNANYSSCNNVPGSGNQGDILQDIANDRLPELRDVFKVNWPRESQPYFFIDMIIQWRKKWPDLPIKFMSPHGRWKDGTLIAIQDIWNYKIYFATLEPSGKELIQALYTTKKISWERGPFIIDVHEKMIDDLMTVLIPKLELPIEKFLFSAYWLVSKEKAIQHKINCPSDVYLAPLSPKDAIFINDQWPKIHQFPGSVNFIRTLIEMNKGMGVFGKEKNELRAWTNVNEFGALGTLQTLDEHKRKGYASLIVKEISKKRAIEGSDTIACILQDNIASINMFANLGFVRIHYLRCVLFKNTERI